MRIVVEDPIEFCAEIDAEYKNLRNGIVRYRVDRVPEQAEALTFAVWVHMSAVIADETGGYLLEFSQPAGSDDGDGPNGTKQAEKWIGLLQAVRDERKEFIELRPGKIELI